MDLHAELHTIHDAAPPKKNLKVVGFAICVSAPAVIGSAALPGHSSQAMPDQMLVSRLHMHDPPDAADHRDGAIRDGQINPWRLQD